ncbi:5-dehydro-4-deoxyglucarate dehydratase [Streptomyces hirsutus]
MSPGTGTGTDAETDTAAVVRRLRDAMAGGVLSFPLTAFHDDGTLDPDGQRAYLARRLAAGPGALFPACGTGEFFSLDEDEYRQVVVLTVEEAAARLRGRPVGPVRAPLTDPPLTDPSPSDLTDLKALLAAGLDLVGAAL